jgi:hypothetical protein
MSYILDHDLLYRDDVEYRDLVNFIRDNQPVDGYDPRLDRWSPTKYPKINGPLTIAEVFTKVIKTGHCDDNPIIFTLNPKHPFSRTEATR